jgi:predicted dehydrogenase
MTTKKVRWGLLSTARINERLIPAIRASGRSELLAVASRDQARAEQFAATWHIPRAYGSYEALLADPDLDLVYIPLPNSLHEEWTAQSARAGKHILCEKPLALTPEAVDRMATAVAENGIIIF